MPICTPATSLTKLRLPDPISAQATESELRDRLAAVASHRDALDAEAEQLRGEVAEKMQLLEEFEARFKRQYM